MINKQILIVAISIIIILIYQMVMVDSFSEANHNAGKLYKASWFVSPFAGGTADLDYKEGNGIDIQINTTGLILPAEMLYVYLVDGKADPVPLLLGQMYDHWRAVDLNGNETIEEGEGVRCKAYESTYPQNCCDAILEKVNTGTAMVRIYCGGVLLLNTEEGFGLDPLSNKKLIPIKS